MEDRGKERLCLLWPSFSILTPSRSDSEILVASQRSSYTPSKEGSKESKPFSFPQTGAHAREGWGRGSKGCLWSAFSLPSPHTYLLELLDLGLIKHGEDTGAPALCHCPSLGLLGCLKDEGWAEGFVNPSLLLWGQ